MAASATLFVLGAYPGGDPSVVNHEIRGDWSQTVLCRLDGEQELYCEPGRFVWKTSNVSVETRRPVRARGDASRGRGLLGRALSAPAGRIPGSASSPSLPHFRATEASGLCAFTGPAPGKVRQIELDAARTWIVAREAFVAAEGTVGFRLEPGAGKNSEARELVRFAGPGSLFIAAGGTFLDLNPADYGGEIHADVGAVIAFEDGVGLTVGDGRGFPVATLRGDGKVLLRA